MEKRRETNADRLRALGATGAMPIRLRAGRAHAAAMAWLGMRLRKCDPFPVIIDTVVRLLRIEDRALRRHVERARNMAGPAAHVATIGITNPAPE